ncbi:NAD(P)-dependent oxidoreductase [Porticoccus sp.]|uniref:NAD(P)-dependent oxidoreductase n=1 Tax=Porticoccus sp. TaxID=2024853 RepID=UPI000C4D3CC4|nr:NAD(P)-dependent oxidoreductase [Porticoccus sp.]MAZ70507.1 oxidoreductase [Porticoccus sp.]|tara:strand:- start:588 stop:1475 length:888 start_codon:yes stop_codon:yes gene_type:complete
MKNIAFIGLGVMGFPMAGHLSKAGFSVCVYNRTRQKAAQWLEQYTGFSAPTPAAAVKKADIVFTCVGGDESLQEVLLGASGGFSGASRGTLFVDHTTVSAKVSRELAKEASRHKMAYLDAPVSGGQQGAERGSLTVMIGGEKADFQRVTPIIKHYASKVSLMGPAGSGQLCKMANQICVAGIIESLAEGLFFARQAGLDPSQVIEVISKGAAQSWQMENRYQTMLAGEYNHGFAVDWMCKDLAIVLEEARLNGSDLPVTKLISEFYREVQLMGGGQWDTSSLLARLEKTENEVGS